MLNDLGSLQQHDQCGLGLAQVIDPDRGVNDFTIDLAKDGLGAAYMID